MEFVRTSIALPKKTRVKLEQLAKHEIRTLSNMVAFLIETYEERFNINVDDFPEDSGFAYSRYKQHKNEDKVK